VKETTNVNAGGAQQTRQVAKQEASATTGQAKEAADEAVGTAREQAAAVTGEAGEEARTVVRDLWERVIDETQSQTQRTAGTLRQWADDLSGLAHNAPADSPARDLVAQAADGGHRGADYLDRRGADGLAEDVQEFARRRPAVFLGGALLAGFAIGRLVKAGGTTRGGSDRGPSPQVPATGGPSSPGDAQRRRPEELGYPEV
jgi:hypothetical protein